MICPVCQEPMVVLELDKIEIDHCINCGGIWLDEGELELLLETEEERNRLKDLFKEARSVKEKSYPCPRCGKRMNKVFVGEERKVIIDKCKKNHGLWFDQGELQKVVEIDTGNSNGKIIKLLNQMFENKLSSKNDGGSK
jgi:Zn-finger nucleic acid-binding protein